MADTTGIEWTESTWNPWMGCTKVSPGCANCYMFREQKRYGSDPTTVRRSKTKFSEPLTWPDGRLIFTCSWSDWFHADADQWRDEAWDVVRRCPQHTFQILTKRSERIPGGLPPDWGGGYPNVWLGVSVENQRHAHRVLDLMEVPAVVRFVSAEPLLGPVDFTRIVRGGQVYNGLAGIQWVIAGGESGPGYRPMQDDWARAVRDQCEASGVAFMLKQLGGWPDKRGHEKAVLDGVHYAGMPAERRAPRPTPYPEVIG